MKIAFCGDSYCILHSSSAWTTIIKDHYDADIVCSGSGGASLYFSYKNFIHENVVDEADYIVFCITDPFRFVNRMGLPINSSTAFHKDHFIRHNTTWLSDTRKTNKQKKDAIACAKLYYESIIDYEYHEFIQKCIIEKLDELMIEKKKKCIWFPCFDNSFGRLEEVYYIPKSGPVAEVSLRNISGEEFKDMSSKEYNAYAYSAEDTRVCHLNEENNKILAQIIINYIDGIYNELKFNWWDYA